jgi:hypothetical protein
MLMQLDNNKYKLLKEGGHWNAPLVEEEKSLALQTQETPEEYHQEDQLQKDTSMLRYMLIKLQGGYVSCGYRQWQQRKKPCWEKKHSFNAQKIAE